MPRTDTGNFNRFLTSLGLLLLLAAILVPYFYFHDTDTLRISVKELNGLTQVARDALETRQRRAADLEVWVLVFAGILGVSGVVALWFGGRRLRLAQVKEDAAIDRKAKRDDVEIEQMSQSEVDEKQKVEAQVAIEEEQGRPRPAARPGGLARRSADMQYQEWRDAMARIEDEAKQALAADVPPTHLFIPNAKIVRGAQQLRLDGIYRSSDRDGLDVILRLVVIQHIVSMQKSVGNRANEILALLSRYEHMGHRRATGWVVVVLADQEERPSVEERRQLEDRLNESLIEAGRATVLFESEVGDLPKRFNELLKVYAK